MMHWKVRREFLSRVEVFENLGRRDLKSLARTCSESSYESGEYLCRQGERGVTAFLIASGEIEVVSESGEEETVVATLGQGTMVGELSIIDGAERVASIRAKGTVNALVITQWDMLALLHSRPHIAATMLPIIVKRFRATARQLREADRRSDESRRSIYQ